MKKSLFNSIGFILLAICTVTALRGHIAWCAEDLRRPLRVALYPYVPEKGDMYWKLEQAFENRFADIDLRFLDLGANYYGGQLVDALTNHKVDVAEVDTVFLQDLADQKLILELPAADLEPTGTFLPVAEAAAKINNRTFGVPHWVCGNFLFFRVDDPESDRFRQLWSLDGLERILGRLMAQEPALLIDLKGKSTLGEKYLDALLDLYQDPVEALQHVKPSAPNAEILRSLARVFALCPNGLCDSNKHHEFGQYYARQFAHRKARVMIGYSEQMHFVVDEFLHGVREDEPAIGVIQFSESDGYAPKGVLDVNVVPAPLANPPLTNAIKMLAWVDVLTVSAASDGTTRQDAMNLIHFFNSVDFTRDLLVPEYGHAPRYLLPARVSLYTDPKITNAAPLYPHFFTIMKDAVSLTSPNLNEKLRDIGKQIDKAGFPVE